jgi:hypothetical protein
MCFFFTQHTTLKEIVTSHLLPYTVEGMFQKGQISSD